MRKMTRTIFPRDARRKSDAIEPRLVHDGPENTSISSEECAQKRETPLARENARESNSAKFPFGDVQPPSRPVYRVRDGDIEVFGKHENFAAGHRP